MDYSNTVLQEKMESVFEENLGFREAMNEYNLVREVYDSRLNN